MGETTIRLSTSVTPGADQQAVSSAACFPIGPHRPPQDDPATLHLNRDIPGIGLRIAEERGSICCLRSLGNTELRPSRLVMPLSHTGNRSHVGRPLPETVVDLALERPQPWLTVTSSSQPESLHPTSGRRARQRQGRHRCVRQSRAGAPRCHRHSFDATHAVRGLLGNDFFQYDLTPPVRVTTPSFIAPDFIGPPRVSHCNSSRTSAWIVSPYGCQPPWCLSPFMLDV